MAKKERIVLIDFKCYSIPQATDKFINQLLKKRGDK